MGKVNSEFFSRNIVKFWNENRFSCTVLNVRAELWGDHVCMSNFVCTFSIDIATSTTNMSWNQICTPTRHSVCKQQKTDCPFLNRWVERHQKENTILVCQKFHYMHLCTAHLIACTSYNKWYISAWNLQLNASADGASAVVCATDCTLWNECTPNSVHSRKYKGNGCRIALFGSIPYSMHTYRMNYRESIFKWMVAEPWASRCMCLYYIVGTLH